MSTLVSLSDYRSHSDRAHELSDNQSSSMVADESQLTVEEEWQPSKHEKAIIYTLAMISLIVALDATIIITPLNVTPPPPPLSLSPKQSSEDILTTNEQTIIEDLNGDATQAFWIGTSYLLVNAVTMPFICSVSDVFGRPICLTFALVAFTIGTICCCTARTVGPMLVGRCIQGVGGAGIHSLGLVTQTGILPCARYQLTVENLSAIAFTNY